MTYDTMIYVALAYTVLSKRLTQIIFYIRIWWSKISLIF